MLTEIEWWGGLLIIWLVLCYTAIYKEYSGEPKLEVNFLSTSAAFLFAGITLVLYFYTLDQPLIQYIYVGFIGLGVVSAILMVFWPETESTKSDELEESGEDDEEELGKVYEVLGHLLLFFPIIASLGLGIYKASEFLSIFS